MSVIRRAIKVLDKGPGGARWSATKAQPLPDRIGQFEKAMANTRSPTSIAGNGDDLRITRQREILLLGSGHAINKLVLVAAWFRSQQGYAVTVRTCWSSTIDDVLVFSGDEVGTYTDTKVKDVHDNVAHSHYDEGDKLGEVQGPTQESARMRNVSCLEVAIRLR